MGHKINPISFRIGYNKTWSSKWFPLSMSNVYKRDSYADFLEEDELIRKIINKKAKQTGISRIEIKRTSNDIKILIKSARPGLIIGQKGKGIEELTGVVKKEIKKLRSGRNKAHAPGKSQNFNLSLDVEELRRFDISARHIALQIASDIERRMPYRWTMKKYVEQASQNKEVKGIKVLISGRLNGAEIARKEYLKRGLLPLNTLRADIDYGYASAFATYGVLGIKVWIYKGDIFSAKKSK